MSIQSMHVESGTSSPISNAEMREENEAQSDRTIENKYAPSMINIEALRRNILLKPFMI